MDGHLVLALNCGSSSIKFALFDGSVSPLPRVPLWRGSAQGIGGPQPVISAGDGPPARLPLDAAAPYASALRHIRARISGFLAGRRLGLIVHRVVHGGGKYGDPVRLDAAVLEELRRCIPLAPLHQPHALEAIALMLEAEPGVPQVACFDTAFHGSMPLEERVLPLPWAAFRQGIRRYGFHGLSYAYLAVRLAERHGGLARGRVVAMHLGSGASLCAMRNFTSVATTMGFSALDGVMMGTRSGAIDAGVLLHYLQVEGLTPGQVAHLLYHESGLLGVSGISSEPRVLLQHEHDAGETGERARLALALYVRSIVRETAALAAVLGGLDMLVFTAGVGENCAEVRERTCNALGWLGVRLDPGANARHAPVISAPDSRVRVVVEPTNEEWMAATQALACVGANAGGALPQQPAVPGRMT